MAATTAWLLFVLGVGHVVYGFVKFREPLLSGLAAGVVGQFTSPEVRRTAFWFVMFGPLLMLAGQVAIHAVGITTALGMTVLVECNGRDATAMHHGLVGVPGIKGGIGSDVGGKEAQGGDRTDVEGNKGGDIILVKGLGIRERG